MTGFFVHESSYVDVGAVIGDGTKIWYFCHVEADSHIGNNCQLGQNVYIGKGVRVGSGCKIQNNVSIYSDVELSDDVFCGPSCVFTNDLTPRAAFPKGPSGWIATKVGKGATIGANSTIVCGNELGEYCMVAAGAVVTKDVPPYTLVKGNPAREYAYVCACGSVLDDDLICPACAIRYLMGDSGIRPIEA